ncbi:MAG TPA: iron chelate uptake ABC transporter family permease subunit, partial [Sphingobacteriaceae bacterium]|nr:iron chelate uptake ABC transporter family permease subunit [Sphingobacteriaceae bacterium]
EHLGIPLQRIKKYIIVLSAIGVGACVAAAGMIGFIALVVPHILRISVSSNHYFVLPASALLGASVLVVSDLLARTIAAPSELPIGILTAILGVPVFIYIIIKSNSIKSTI